MNKDRLIYVTFVLATLPKNTANGRLSIGLPGQWGSQPTTSCPDSIVNFSFSWKERRKEEKRRELKQQRSPYEF
jgi:hypothetical protein